MQNRTAPTDQRAGVRPIAFALQTYMGIGSPITLRVRPEDLVRNEPSRVTVHQTLSPDGVTGWVDNFGEGMPSVTISGHTGWRAYKEGGQDGVTAFNALNDLVQHNYHAAVRAAINSGMDPSTVKLLFIDMLDNFVWNVTPTAFQLRRSKSRPLLMMYNITLQAIDTEIDNPFMVLPFLPSLPVGLSALRGVVDFLRSVSSKIQSVVATAVAFKNAALAPIASTIHELHVTSVQVFEATWSATSAINNGVNGTANDLIRISSDLANVGVNIYRTFAAIEGIPDNTKAALVQVASSYNEVLCIFSNSLKPSQVYEDYTPLYGASNCSSTTGGRAPSIYANSNAFELLQDENPPVSTTTSAQTAINSINRGDPVLKPIEIAEIGRLAGDINAGIVIE